MKTLSRERLIATLALALALAAPVSALAHPGSHDRHDHATEAPASPAEKAVGTTPATTPATASNASSDETAPAPIASEVRADVELRRCLERTERHPEDPDGWSNLGDLHMQRSRDRLDPSLYPSADAAYRRALTIDPRHVPALIGMAWVANSRHAFDEGRRWAREALTQNPHATEAHALLGDAAVEAGAYDEAMEHYQAALDARPDLASLSRAAHVLWLTGDVRRATALMNRAIQAGGPHPENTAWCRAELAMIYLHQGALVAAGQQVERALREAPGHPHALAVAGRLAMAGKDYARAIRLFEQARAMTPQHASLAALAELYAWTGRPADAARATAELLAFHEAHIHETGSPEAPASLVPAPSSLRESATETVAAAAADDPQNDHLHGHGHPSAELARFLADQSRDLDTALEHAEGAYRAFPNLYAADAVAWCLYRKGRYEDAARFIRRALRWNTQDASLFFHAGLIHDALGDRAAARRYLHQAISLNPHFHPVQAGIAFEKLRELGSATEVAHAVHPPTSGR